MFRRKDEEETQDLLTGDAGSHVPTLGDGNQDKQASEGKSAQSSGSSNASASSYPSYNSRSSEQSKASAQSSATSYRPAAPSAPDIARGNRVPEYRPATSTAATTSSAATPSPAKDTKPTASKRVLTVGHDILLKGEIATCDRLVIEGSVDASLNEVHTVEIAESGSFKGAAEIEDAEISGEFEGELIVRNRLVIYSTGKVRGKITFGEIEIERGGEMTGEIQTIAQATAGKGGNAKRAKSKEADAVAA